MSDEIWGVQYKPGKEGRATGQTVFTDIRRATPDAAWREFSSFLAEQGVTDYHSATVWRMEPA